MANKGTPFERKIAKRLSMWWTHNERNDVFWRTAGSGARATVRRKKDKDTANSCGDLTFIDPIGQPLINWINIELKKGYNKHLSVMATIDSKQKPPLIIKWWLKAVKEAAESGRPEVAIIFQRTSMQPCIVLSTVFMGELEGLAGEFQHDEVHICYENVRIVIIELELFLSWIDPQHIIDLQ